MHQHDLIPTLTSTHSVFICIEPQAFISYNNFWPHICMSLFGILYKYLFTLECWTLCLFRPSCLYEYCFNSYKYSAIYVTIIYVAMCWCWKVIKQLYTYHSLRKIHHWIFPMKIVYVEIFSSSRVANKILSNELF